MRCARAVLVCLLTALVLSGCMGRSGPVAVVQPQGDLDTLAYGQAYAQPLYAPSPAGYVAPAYAGSPVAYDRQYRLDAGDKLRVVVYGQEGLTNSYAIDAGGSITMPLIGAV
ncbi:MAG: polysaccharide export protein, partial [Tardiphaga sp.]|nr:polysaccharide export protein [Tardiphaga sp.]